jgi:hypothetical protein
MVSSSAAWSGWAMLENICALDDVWKHLQLHIC